jgi:hypothetical protein
MVTSRAPLESLLSQDVIRKLTIASNVEYGTAIYKRGGVEILKLDDEEAEGWVGGLDGNVKEGAGQIRRTRLFVTDEGLAWHCAGNPKDHDIFCKHCVALALAIIDSK